MFKLKTFFDPAQVVTNDIVFVMWCLDSDHGECVGGYSVKGICILYSVHTGYICQARSHT